MEQRIKIGCIADDFTGASDAASFLAKAGLKTLLLNGIPTSDINAYYDAAVIALKTRSIQRSDAVSQSMQAIAWLEERGTEHFYSKYCSTFDSTPKGNIGPILDAIVEELDQKTTVLCPALPVNGRTVKNGILYVNGVPLSESSMKDHPLNPMWASGIAELMKPQSKYPCLVIQAELMRRGKEAVWNYIAQKAANWKRFYIIPDYYQDEHAQMIAEIFGELSLLSGGSGILEALGRRAAGGEERENLLHQGAKGKAIILAGSCSVATRRQIASYAEAGGNIYKIDPVKLSEGKENVEHIWKQICEKDEILVFSSDSPEEVKNVQKLLGEKASQILESTVAQLAVCAVKNGYTRVIVAGGETSGAVTQALGQSSYLIGESVAPGVPVMIPLTAPELRIVLKSGNFGQDDFFLKALKMTSEEADVLDR